MYQLGTFAKHVEITSHSYHQFVDENWRIAPIIVNGSLMLLHVDTCMGRFEDKNFFQAGLEKLSEVIKSGVLVSDVFVVNRNHSALLYFQTNQASVQEFWFRDGDYEAV